MASRSMKQFAIPLVPGEMQMQTTAKRQYLLSTMANSNPNQPTKQNDHKSSTKGVIEQKFSYISGTNAKCVVFCL